MWKLYSGLIGSFILATLLCGWGQTYAYLLNDYVKAIHPVHFLTGMTFTAYFFYLISGICLFFIIKKQSFAKKYKEFYIMIFLFLTIPPSAWALFVTAMWWG